MGLSAMKDTWSQTGPSVDGGDLELDATICDEKEISGDSRSCSTAQSSLSRSSILAGMQLTAHSDGTVGHTRHDRDRYKVR